MRCLSDQSADNYLYRSGWMRLAPVIFSCATLLDVSDLGATVEYYSTTLVHKKPIRLYRKRNDGSCCCWADVVCRTDLRCECAVRSSRSLKLSFTVRTLSSELWTPLALRPPECTEIQLSIHHTQWAAMIEIVAVGLLRSDSVPP